MRSSRTKLLLLLSAVPLATAAGLQGGGAAKVQAASPHTTLNCVTSAVCTEVQDSEQVFGEGKYVGHDEPSTLFYSNRPGSGNSNVWKLTLPTDPSAANPLHPGKSYNFQLHPAFWFGMAMCDTQSYPEQKSTCTPDSDRNILDPAISVKHAGTAFMEMQFYPPGWVTWPAGNSCDPTKWCAALNIDSLSENPVTGQLQNATCQAHAGLEYVNFAFLTKSGKPQPNSPPSPVNATVNTFTPNRSADLFMGSGDKLTVDEHDTAHGLRIVVNDMTTGTSGSMTASAANGFGQVKFAPTGSRCVNIPYDFHPMYSTSSEQTRVVWAAHSYNVAFADEIGHFDFCGDRNVTFGGSCTTTEGNGANKEAADADDVGCFDKTASSLVKVSGCLGTNNGFDGQPYQPVWPDGNYRLHPTPIQFSSPTSNGNNFDRMAFEADLPRIEYSTGSCDRDTGVGCTLIPITDDGNPASFYPFFSTTGKGGNCMWQLGSQIPGSTNSFGQNAQYGTLLSSTYSTLGGSAITHFNNFRQVLSSNPCRTS